MQEDKTVVERWRYAAIIIWATIGIAVLIGLMLFVFNRIQSILTPFIYALALVYILRPIVNFLEERNIPRILALTISYLLFLVVLVLFLLYLVPIVIAQAGEFAGHFPQYVKAIQDALLDYQGRFDKLQIPPEGAKFIEESLASLKKSVAAFALRLPAASVGLVSNFVSGFFYFVLSPVIAFYLLKDLHKIRETVVGLIPSRHRKEALTIVHKIDIVIGGFVKGQLLVSLLVGVLIYLWLLIIGVDYPLIIGMVSGVLNIIPYFGQVVGALLAIGVAAFESWKLALLAGVGIFIIQQLDGLVISPHIMSSQVKLHPSLIIFSLLIGGYLYGIMGMLLAIPVAAICKALVYHFLESSNETATKSKPRTIKPAKK